MLHARGIRHEVRIEEPELHAVVANHATDLMVAKASQGTVPEIRTVGRWYIYAQRIASTSFSDV